MLVCDQAIREAETNKVSLVGIFDQIRGAEFPLAWARPTAVYARVTDAEGHYQMRLELVRLEDEQSASSLSAQGAMSSGSLRAIVMLAAWSSL
jgi:hypothetical protein